MAIASAKNTYQQAMQSHDPYGVIVRWHNDGKWCSSTGGDLDAYRQRILEEALKDPEYQRRVIEATQGSSHGVRPHGRAPRQVIGHLFAIARRYRRRRR